jgi:hypothetical protein
MSCNLHCFIVPIKIQTFVTTRHYFPCLLPSVGTVTFFNKTFRVTFHAFISGSKFWLYLMLALTTERSLQWTWTHLFGCPPIPVIIPRIYRSWFLDMSVSNCFAMTNSLIWTTVRWRTHGSLFTSSQSDCPPWMFLSAPGETRFVLITTQSTSNLDGDLFPH